MRKTQNCGVEGEGTGKKNQMNMTKVKTKEIIMVRGECGSIRFVLLQIVRLTNWQSREKTPCNLTIIEWGPPI